MKQFLKSLQLRWSDLFISLATIFGIVVCVEGTSLMGVRNPVQTIMPFGMLTAFFAIAIVLLACYFFFEFKVYKNHFHLLPLCIILILLIIGCLLLFIQPLQIDICYPNRTGDPFGVSTVVSYQVRLIFFFNYFLILSVFYVVLFVLPERVKNSKFVLFVVNIICAVGLFAFLFSLITEFTSYGLFFKNIFSSGEIENIATKSFLGHKNVYGALLECSIFTSIIAYTLGKKKVNFIFIGIYYIALFFTLCKTAILIATFTLICFIVFYILFMYKDDKKKLMKTTIIIGSIVIALIAISIVCILAIPALREKILDNDTVVGREKIWEKGLFIAKDYIIIGRGYGLYNSLLLNVNVLVLDDPSFSSHSMIISLVGRGGILALISYLSLIGYFIKELVDEFKINKEIFFCFALVLLGVFVHSLFEDHYYLIVALFAIFEIVKHSQTSETRQKQIVLL